MSWWRFLFWNAVGSSLWAASVGVATFYAGQAAVDAIARYGTYGHSPSSRWSWLLSPRCIS